MERKTNAPRCYSNVKATKVASLKGEEQGFRGPWKEKRMREGIGNGFHNIDEELCGTVGCS